ncbi:MAG TPA: ATP-binding protein [Myxococcota bacterium]|nr:ATP-binding protein [Myxococcota bacterium]
MNTPLPSPAVQAALFAALPDVMIRVGADGNYREILLPHGYPEVNEVDGLHGTSLYSTLTPEDGTLWQERVDHCRTTGQMVTAIQRRVVAGVPRAWEVRMVRVSDEEVLCLARDVSSEQAMLRQLEDQSRLLRQLGSTTPLIMYVYDLTQRKNVYINRSLVEELGYDAAQAVAWGDDPLPHLAHPQDQGRMTVDMGRLFSAPPDTVVRSEGRLRHADGSWRVYRSWSTVLSRDKNGVPQRLCGVLADDTERILMEEQLRQAEKMEVVGQLAGSIAHDFNNVLTTILGYAQVLVSNLPPGENREDARELSIAAERAAVLTRRLLTYVRRQPREVGVLPLVEAVHALAPMLRRLMMNPRHRLHMELPRHELFVRLDRSEMEQALVNLVINARDALGSSGNIRVWLQPVGNRVELGVEDDGAGMSEGVQRRAFEPFFTTKPAGSGTGLGLTSVQRLVNDSEGSISLESAPGRGTRVRILLPALSAAPSASPPPNPLMPGTRLLVLEEDPGLRSYLQATLSREGWWVEVTGEAAAVDHALRDDKIDILMVDLGLRGGQGPELVRRLRDQRPGLRILPTSGQEASFEGLVVLRKPFTPAELVAALGRHAA